LNLPLNLSLPTHENLPVHENLPSPAHGSLNLSLPAHENLPSPKLAHGSLPALILNPRESLLKLPKLAHENHGDIGLLHQTLRGASVDVDVESLHLRVSQSQKNPKG